MKSNIEKELNSKLRNIIEDLNILDDFKSNVFKIQKKQFEYIYSILNDDINIVSNANSTDFYFNLNGTLINIIDDKNAKQTIINLITERYEDYIKKLDLKKYKKSKEYLKTIYLLYITNILCLLMANLFICILLFSEIQNIIYYFVNTIFIGYFMYYLTKKFEENMNITIDKKRFILDFRNAINTNISYMFLFIMIILIGNPLFNLGLNNTFLVINKIQENIVLIIFILSLLFIITSFSHIYNKSIDLEKNKIN